MLNHNDVILYLLKLINFPNPNPNPKTIHNSTCDVIFYLKIMCFMLHLSLYNYIIIK